MQTVYKHVLLWLCDGNGESWHLRSAVTSSSYLSPTPTAQFQRASECLEIWNVRFTHKINGPWVNASMHTQNLCAPLQMYVQLIEVH